jgi:hypothetical protein
MTGGDSVNIFVGAVIMLKHKELQGEGRLMADDSVGIRRITIRREHPPLQGARYSNRIGILSSVQRSSDMVDHN